MAESVRLPEGEARIRNLWVVLLLILVTFGIYYLYWYYAINGELRDYGRTRDKALDISPGWALMAIWLGWFLIVPPFISAWRTVRRVQRAEELTGIQNQHRINHALGFVLFIVGFIVFPVEIFYLQAHLNRLWRHLRDEEEKQSLGMRGVAAT